jgi:RNA polymerase sigma factor (sigma-70 family)
MKLTPTVFVVDDEEPLRDSLRWLIQTVGLAVETYASGEEFLKAYDPNKPGCVVLDVRMPGLSGLAVLEQLMRQEHAPPVIVLTAHGDVSMAVRALKGGAVEFLEKPYKDQDLLDCIQQSIQRDAQRREQQARRRALAARLARLTPREHEVMERMVAGKPNKVIASQLKISEKTIEAHRAKVMEKMEVDSLAELVRLVLTHFPEEARL